MKCFVIMNSDNEYLTRQNIDSKYTFTKNINFAYSYEDSIIPQKIINALFDNQKVRVIEIDY